MKKCFLIFLALSILCTITTFGEDSYLEFVFDNGNKNNFNVTDNKSNVNWENGNIVGNGTTLPSFYLQPNKPIKINNLDFTIKYKLRVISAAKPSYISIRHYGVDSSMNMAMIVARIPVSEKWYEGEYQLYKAGVSSNSISFTENSLLKQLRIDCKNTTEENVKLEVEYIKVENKESSLPPTMGADEIKLVETKISEAKAGDTITIPNNTYSNIDFVVNGKGTKEKPITIKAESIGGVIFTGKSSLTISGENIVVDGLVFKDGWSPKVITFSDNSLNCRLTNSSIINYNDKDKKTDTRWVTIKGNSNRIDHCLFKDKKNMGVLLEIIRTTPEKNNHLVDNNYFLNFEQGIGNGAETVRIGTGTYAQSISNTTIKNNYFEKCDGEAEIISIKSQGNHILNNTVYNSNGFFTLRMGSGNLLEGNLFYKTSGGIRVIDKDQVIKNNYFYKISSVGMTLESGTDPNPAAYYPVINANISNNTFLDCAKAVSVNYSANPETGRIYSPKANFNSNLFVGGNIFEEVSGGGELKFQNNAFNGTVLGLAKKYDGIIENSLKTIFDETGYIKSQEQVIGADVNVIKNAPLSAKSFLDKYYLSNYEISEISFDNPDIKDDIVILGIDKKNVYSKKDGIKEMDPTPTLINSKTMVPLRFISEAFSSQVIWNEKTEEITIKNGVDTIVLKIGSVQMNKNNDVITLETPPTLIGERTFVPIRAITESLGKKVFWDDRGIIIIASDSTLNVDTNYFDKVIEYMSY